MRDECQRSLTNAFPAVRAPAYKAFAPHSLIIPSRSIQQRLGYPSKQAYGVVMMSHLRWCDVSATSFQDHVPAGTAPNPDEAAPSEDKICIFNSTNHTFTTRWLCFLQTKASKFQLFISQHEQRCLPSFVSSLSRLHILDSSSWELFMHKSQEVIQSNECGWWENCNSMGEWKWMPSEQPNDWRDTK